MIRNFMPDGLFDTKKRGQTPNWMLKLLKKNRYRVSLYGGLISRHAIQAHAMPGNQASTSQRIIQTKTIISRIG
jgi:hypothetical protein